MWVNREEYELIKMKANRYDEEHQEMIKSRSTFEEACKKLKDTGGDEKKEITVPILISNNFEPYCRECKLCKPEMITSTVYMGDKSISKVLISCENMNMCRQIWKLIDQN